MSTYVPPSKTARVAKEPKEPRTSVSSTKDAETYTPENNVAAQSRFLTWMTAAKRASYSSSVVRILFGISLLAYFGTSFQDRHYLWGVASGWVDPQAARQGWPTIFSLLFSKDNAAVFDVQYVIFLLLLVVFIVGWKTKFVTPLVGFFYLSLVSNTIVTSNGGDTLVRITLLFLIFADLSQHWSVDSFLRKTRKRSLPARGPLVPEWFSIPLHNAAIILCAYQIMLVYVTSGIYKSMGADWMNGSALYYSMILDVFQVQPALTEFVWQNTLFVSIGTFLSIWVQLLFPLMVLWRPTRVLALIFLLGMHFGIGLFLGLWPFSIPMMALDLLFVRDSSWEAAIKWLTNLWSNIKQLGKSLTAPSAS